MSDYRLLLNATIQHLEDLRQQGVLFVNVSPNVLQGLSQTKVFSGFPPSIAGTPGSLARISSPVPSLELSSPVTSHRPPMPRQQPNSRWSQAAALATAPIANQRPLPPKLSPAAKEIAFQELRRRVLSCVKCPNLVGSRKQVVFGVGTMDAELMFIGEAPGADEDEAGEPFVGKAGQLLTKIIQAMGVSREHVFIANILKCRPDTPGQTAGNRKPTPLEMETCIPYLHEQIDLIQPKALVALGSTAFEGLLGKSTVGITKIRGQWQSFRGIPLMPTYHPAYLLRNQSLSIKREVWEDMLLVMEKLAMPISEKQRGYFLK